MAQTEQHTPGPWAGGITLRDWFAGQCMAALLTNASNPEISPERFAACAYMAADAMLAVRTLNSTEER